MEQDQDHIRLLSVFHFIVAGLLFVMGSCFSTYIIIGVLALTGRMGESPRPGQEPFPATLFGSIFIVAGTITLTVAWSMAFLAVAAGLKLRRYRSHKFCVIVAAILCMFMPFGTALGVFTLIVLLRPSVKTLFGVATPAAPVIAAPNP